LLSGIRDLASLERMADLLAGRVGSLLSLQSLREDLEVSHRAVSHWLREVDFLVTPEGKPWFALESKISDRTVSPALRYFGDRLQIPWLYQITLQGQEDVLDGPVRVMPATKFLAALP
jgi:predicted AAA+ superfamily ATPase